MARPIKISAGNTEAVFSSSEDRIRASQADAAGARPPIASRTGARPADRAKSGGSWAGRIAESLFAVLFPSDCRICGDPLIRISRLPVCEDCLDAMCPIADGVCSVCGERLFSPYALAGDSRCGVCRRAEPPFARAAAYGSYEGGLRELIHLLKYGGVRPAANVLGRMLTEALSTLETEFAGDLLAVVPVPLHRTKLRRRGFNQAELIARAALKIKSHNRFRLCAGVLQRKRETASQIGLSRHQRRENLRGAFIVLQADLVKGREVLLVDDVFTTGATVSECARVLRRAGAAKVWVATVARTLKISAQLGDLEPVFSGSETEHTEVRPVPMARAVGL